MMGSENQQDEFLKSLFQETEVRGELNLTEKVMRQIQETPASKSITYEPPISKKGWIVIGSLFTLLLGYAFWLESSFTMPEFSLDISSYATLFKNNIRISLPKLPSLSVPFLAAILAFNVAGVYFMMTYWRSRRV